MLGFFPSLCIFSVHSCITWHRTMRLLLVLLFLIVAYIAVSHGKFYSVILNEMNSLNSIVAGRHLGCYTDYKKRVLAGPMKRWITDNTPSKCEGYLSKQGLQNVRCGVCRVLLLRQQASKLGHKGQRFGLQRSLFWG